MESPRWWSKETIAVVTGANKGIGLEIVRQLAREGITTILTARDEGRGHKAVSDLMKQEEDINVMFHQLDVTDSTSIHNLATWIKHQFGGLDILVNNAGIVLRLNSNPTPDEVLAAAKEVLETNYYGSKNLTDALLPLFRPSAAGSRIVNVSSSGGQLSVVGNDKWRKQLDDDNVKHQVIESFIQSYLEDCAQGKNAVLQQPSKEAMDVKYGNYMISKIALNAHMRSLAHDLVANRKEGEKIFLNSMCPGATATDMTVGIGHSVEEGADTAVWLALLPASECVAGKFFLCRKDRGFVFIEELYEDAPELKLTH